MVYVFAGLVEFSICKLMMLKPTQGWFIKAYLLLYIISPVLNAFVENVSRRTLRNVLVAYWYFWDGCLRRPTISTMGIPSSRLSACTSWLVI